jgi:hypothetical protein
VLLTDGRKIALSVDPDPQGGIEEHEERSDGKGE